MYNVNHENIVSWNAGLLETRTERGAAKKVSLISLIEQQNAAIVCVQETGLKPQIGRPMSCQPAEQFKISGFKVERLDVEAHEDYSSRGCTIGLNRGILVAFKDNIAYESVEKLKGNFGMWQTFKIFKAGKRNQVAYHLTNLYIRPHKISDEGWKELKSLFSKYKDHIITGDFNLHCTDFGNPHSKNDGDEEKMSDMISKNKFTAINTGEFTHINNNLAGNFSAVDATLVKGNRLTDLSSWRLVNDPMGSDHYPQLISVADHRVVRPAEGNVRLNFKENKANWGEYERASSFEAHRLDIENSDTVDKYDDFQKCFVQAVVESNTIPNNYKHLGKPVPEKRVYNNTGPWSDECTVTKTYRNRYHRHWKADKTNTYKWLLFRSAQKDFERALARAEKLAFENFRNSISFVDNARDAWVKIRVLEGKPCSEIKVGNLKSGDSVAASDLDKAEMLKEHYVKVSSNESLMPEFLAHKNERMKTDEYKNLHERRENDDKSYNKPFRMREMMKQLRKRKKRTATGCDGISYAMIRHAPLFVRETLLRLYNDMWSKGIQPAAHKMAMVITILKKGKPDDDPASYRPISLTSHLGKLFEAMVTFRLRNELEKRRIISRTNSGFRNRKEVLDQLVRLDRTVRNNADDGDYGRMTGVVTLDVKAAFDTADHVTILSCLDKCKIGGNMYNFCRNFLSDRAFRVRVGNSLSTVGNPENGVPQGSVLSPTLFLLSINKISEAIDDPDIEVLCYADDTAIVFSIRKCKAGDNESFYRKCEKWMSDKTNKIVEALQKAGYKVNTEKTQAIIFNNQRGLKGSTRRSIRKRIAKDVRGAGTKPTEWTLNIGGSVIKTQPEVLYLGVIFDTYLTFETHLKTRRNSALGALNVLKKVKGMGGFGKDPHLLKCISKGLLESKLHYGAEIMGGCDKTELAKNDALIYKARNLIAGSIVGTRREAVDIFLGELSPASTREMLKMGYLARKLTSDNNIVTDFLEGENYIKNCNRNYMTVTRGGAKVREITSVGGIFRDTEAKWKNLGLHNPGIATKICTYDNSVEWPDIKIDLSLKEQMKKNESDTRDMFIKAQHLIEIEYREYCPVFTDGSKITKESGNVSNHVIGAGVYSENLGIETSQRLTDNVAICTAELAAIDSALKIINVQRLGEDHRKIAVFSDSLSALQAIRAEDIGNDRADIINSIRETHAVLCQSSIDIVLAWIPAHVGIPG